MLKIKISSDDIYYVNGLTSLLHEVNADQQNSWCSVVPTQDSDMGDAHVMFREAMVSISISKESKTARWCQSPHDNGRIIIHIPFICKQDNLTDIMGKLKKILLIADMDYHAFLNRENYKTIGLKKYLQLSMTESKVMLLVGKGYNPTNISKILNRSEKTINTHCRNATRKLGMLNRVEFYKYAAFIANCGNKERNTLCL